MVVFLLRTVVTQNSVTASYEPFNLGLENMALFVSNVYTNFRNQLNVSYENLCRISCMNIVNRHFTFELLT